jgi:hypothetical protein
MHKRAIGLRQADGEGTESRQIPIAVSGANDCWTNHQTSAAAQHVATSLSRAVRDHDAVDDPVRRFWQINGKPLCACLVHEHAIRKIAKPALGPPDLIGGLLDRALVPATPIKRYVARVRKRAVFV